MPTSEIDTSIRFGDRFVLKLLRRIEPGIHPGVEFGQILTGKIDFTHAAPFAGYLEYQSDSGESTTIAILHGLIPNEGNAWQQTRKELDAFLGTVKEIPQAELRRATPTNIYTLDFALQPPPVIARNAIGPYLSFVEKIGARVAQLHLILATQVDDPAFAPEPFNDFYRQSLYHGYLGLTGRRLEFIRQRYSDMREDMRALASKVLEQESAIIAKFEAVFKQRLHSERTRFHGRLHLGHLLIQEDDVVMFDFEGDPEQHISERRIKRSSMRDLTSMLTSLGYAAQAAIRQTASANVGGDLTTRELRSAGRFWYSHISAAFIRGYWNIAGKASYLPKTLADQQTLLQTYLLERALLDVRADVEDRPELAGMPFRIILHLLDPEAERRTAE
jgi:maltose alpha-D-glucosyltransferase/alpha-amylase